jgi:hypothetical protein
MEATPGHPISRLGAIFCSYVGLLAIGPPGQAGPTTDKTDIRLRSYCGTEVEPTVGLEPTTSSLPWMRYYQLSYVGGKLASYSGQPSCCS